ncbi:MAG: hypothetical protein Tsb007_46490 [Rhizobacter sp.]
MLLALPALAGANGAAGVHVRFDLASPATSPFPSDRFTRVDWSQKTFKRVHLPKPDCAVRPSDCADIDVINQLDGFNTQPRITIPFSGDIDPASVTSDTVYLVNLGDTLSGWGFGQRVGVNQVVWDVATKTLAVESDALLAEHSRYVLVVTNGVRDASGKPIEAGPFGRFRHDLNFGQSRDRDVADYRKSLLDGQHASGAAQQRVVALSLFTTQSTTADLEKIRAQIKRSNPAQIDFNIGASASGPVRAVFATSALAGIQFSRQTGVAPVFTPSFLPTPALNVVPGSVARVAYGRFSSPDYQTAEKYIPVTPTLLGQPRPQGSNQLTVQMFLPSSPMPAGGWPVAIFGHGFTDSMYGAPWTVASVLASQGIATVSINVVGHGGGPLGTLNVLPSAGTPVVVPAGGRGIDQDGNGNIDATEGVNAAAPRSIISSRDGLRQTVVDLMQLVRQIEVGVDVDGDGAVDLNPQRIYYAGQSFGGIYGTILLGVEPNIQAGVPNVPGGSITEVARLGVFRPLTGQSLATRVPSLINVAHPSGIVFNENLPLRDLPPVVNSVPGAAAIQQVLDRYEWVQQAGNPVSYASYIRKKPLRGNAPKPVIVQVAKGDTVVPNPTSSAIVRAGDLADRTTYFRNDLAYAANNAVGKGPHTFLTNIGNAAAAPYAVGAQMQMAVFFASNGAVVIDPDGAGPFFEVPILLPLPEGLNFIP